MRTVFSLLAAVPILAGPAFGWGCEGHQMVALIARAHLTPEASAAIDRLLKDNPIDPSLSRFCMDPPNDLMADSATWADDARNVEQTGEWHYVDIPLAIETGSVPEAEVMRWCPPLVDGRPGCILTAIDYELKILRDPQQSGPARAKALRYLIHFAGDMTQPLHAVDNHDRGGNCTEIRFFTDEKPKNLHGIWDYELIARELAAARQSQIDYAKKIDQDFSADRVTGQQTAPNPAAWAWDSHRLAAEVTYDDLHPMIPVEPAAAGQADQAGCDVERSKVASLHIAIGNEYATKAMPVIREQLAKGGYRLAALLNEALK